MKHVRIVSALAVAAAALLPTAPASADRCQPEELVGGAGTSPIDERDNPFCVIVLQYVYPFLCSDFTTLMRCTQTIDPNTGYRPPLAPAYNPNQARVFCGMYVFALADGACTTASGGRAVSAAGRMVYVRNANGTYNVAYSCQANAVYDAAATRIVSCYVTSNGVSQGNTSLAAPGPVAVAADRKAAVPAGTLRLCFQSQGVFLSGSPVLSTSSPKCVAGVRLA